MKTEIKHMQRISIIWGCLLFLLVAGVTVIGILYKKETKEYKDFESNFDYNGYIVLSNYVPREGDYSEVISGDILTKRGKVAEGSEIAEFPFKKPFVYYVPGSIFREAENEIKGRVLEKIHIDPKVVQIGIPFVLGVNIEE